MEQTVYDIPVQRIDGSDASLADYRGSVLLVVNVASRCGLTPQYTALEQLYRNYREKGLVVLGFPANNFLGQEPGTNEEIQEFCTSTYNVDFPLFSKISVKGEDQHPLYQRLTSAIPEATPNPEGRLRAGLESRGLGPTVPSDVMWNFEKFLVSRDGRVAGRFSPDITPDNPILVQAIEAELAKPA